MRLLYQSQILNCPENGSNHYFLANTLVTITKSSQVTNKLNTEPKQKGQTFIILAFLIFASFATKRMKMISVSIHTPQDKLI